MLRIGDFSRISRVPVKTLRYYDEIGLFRPLRVDDTTGYRLYVLSQLPALHRILALKDLGFSLEQIARLRDAQPAAVIQEMLMAKRNELAARVREEGERLARVEARLRQITQEDMMPAYDVILKQVDPQTIVGVRETIATIGEMSARYGVLIPIIQETLRAHGWKESGPWMQIDYNSGYVEQNLDVELAVPVDCPRPAQATQKDHEVTLRALPGAETMAAVVHHGGYDALGAAYTAIISWINANGYQITGPHREVYLIGPDAPDGPITEIQFPVVKE